MRISDWSSDVCSSDLAQRRASLHDQESEGAGQRQDLGERAGGPGRSGKTRLAAAREALAIEFGQQRDIAGAGGDHSHAAGMRRSDEQTSELQSLMRNTYAVFCLTNKTSSNTIPLTLTNIHT